jgi:hypothetical protein
MVLSKKQAIEAASKAHAKEVASMEKKIDAYLADHYDGHNGLSVPADPLSSVAKQMVIDKYEAQDWKVKFTDSQHDGGFFEFS